ncbi:MAG TPA: hypothetical protein EYG73_07070 [Arcobacter sp.]|nr:hypothetical protein [Arcobacter sp.]
MKKIILIGLLSFLYADENLIDYSDMKERHLYLTNSSQIESMDTVTYMVGIKNRQIRDIFRSFADDLGKSNGAILLENPSKKYFKYIKKSSCSFLDIEKFILFEDRKTETCIPIIITDKKQILNILKDISQLIEDNKEELTEIKLENKVINFIKSSDMNNTLKTSFIDLVKWIF